MKVYAWLIDWFNPPLEKLPHGDDFRVGPKSDRTPWDHTVHDLCDLVVGRQFTSASEALRRLNSKMAIWKWYCFQLTPPPGLEWSLRNSVSFLNMVMLVKRICVALYWCFSYARNSISKNFSQKKWTRNDLLQEMFTNLPTPPLPAQSRPVGCRRWTWRAPWPWSAECRWPFA